MTQFNDDRYSDMRRTNEAEREGEGAFDAASMSLGECKRLPSPAEVAAEERMRWAQDRQSAGDPDSAAVEYKQVYDFFYSAAVESGDEVKFARAIDAMLGLSDIAFYRPDHYSLFGKDPHNLNPELLIETLFRLEQTDLLVRYLLPLSELCLNRLISLPYAERLLALVDQVLAEDAKFVDEVKVSEKVLRGLCESEAGQEITGESLIASAIFSLPAHPKYTILRSRMGLFYADECRSRRRFNAARALFKDAEDTLLQAPPGDIPRLFFERIAEVYSVPALYEPMYMQALVRMIDANVLSYTATCQMYMIWCTADLQRVFDPPSNKVALSPIPLPEDSFHYMVDAALGGVHKQTGIAPDIRLDFLHTLAMFARSRKDIGESVRYLGEGVVLAIREGLDSDHIRRAVLPFLIRHTTNTPSDSVATVNSIEDIWGVHPPKNLVTPAVVQLKGTLLEIMVTELARHAETRPLAAEVFQRYAPDLIEWAGQTEPSTRLHIESVMKIGSSLVPLFTAESEMLPVTPEKERLAGLYLQFANHGVDWSKVEIDNYTPREILMGTKTLESQSLAFRVCGAKALAEQYILHFDRLTAALQEIKSK